MFDTKRTLTEFWLSVANGVNLLDRALSDLRPVICGKKCHWPLIINAINIAFVYSWCIYGIISGEVLSQKEFRRRVVSIMIRRSASQVANEIRLDGVGNYSSPAPVKRCAICKKIAVNLYEKCCQSLYVNTCFQLFHEK